MSISPSKSGSKLTNTNPTTPISPFPSTPHRLSYINSYDEGVIDDTSTHASPTKAAAWSRLNHEVSTVTLWLEGLFAPNAIPPHFLKWRDEAYAAAAAVSAQGASDTVLGIFDSDATRPDLRGKGDQSLDRSRMGPGGGRRNEVLEALNALKQVNLSADHLASLIHEARCEELRNLEEAQTQQQKQRDEGVRARIALDEIYARLSPDATDALRRLSEAAVALGLNLSDESNNDDSEPGGLVALFSSSILKMTYRKLVLDEQVRELNALQSQVEDRTRSLDSEIKASQVEPEKSSGMDHHDEDLNSQTARLNRDTKQINLKIMEYHDRVVNLEKQLAALRKGTNSLGDILDARARVEERRARVKALQERFAAFNGLPPDLEDSRSEVKRAMIELDNLKRRREALFERMGTG